MSLTRKELRELELLLEERDVRRSRKSLTAYTRFTFPKFQKTRFHKTLYKILDLFSNGDIKKLMLSCPPQVGKSEGSTRRMASHIIGRNPDSKIAITCYNATKARKFAREIKRIMATEEYRRVFDVRLATRKDHDYSSGIEEMEVPGHDGFIKAIGVNGGLSGEPVDIMIYDDLYSGYTTGNSPVIRERVWEWIISVAMARLHNDSRQLMTFTRWHEEDVQGKIAEIEGVNTVNTWKEIEDTPKDEWVRVNFEALKTGPPTELDPREPGESLWEEKHSKSKYHAIQKLDPHKFDCVYQGNPDSKHGRLYMHEFSTYDNLPENVSRVYNMTDPSDKGKDYVCSINYVVCQETRRLYLVDMVFDNGHPEDTQKWVASMINRGSVAQSMIESNGIGRGFAEAVNRLTLDIIAVNPFHQRTNKEARVISYAADVNRRWVFPSDWKSRWPRFWDQVTRFKRDFGANMHDDGPDCLTLVHIRNPEREIYVG